MRLANAQQRVPDWEFCVHTRQFTLRVASKGDKPGQRTGLEVRPERAIAIAREG